ncbi:hypothetical protein BACI349Y_50075 [Bacillus sp. 349Y]|nr:hypothetical protein BACI349Y_50075 [Bacillus sp. 349Y]
MFITIPYNFSFTGLIGINLSGKPNVVDAIDILSPFIAPLFEITCVFNTAYQPIQKSVSTWLSHNSLPLTSRGHARDPTR